MAPLAQSLAAAQPGLAARPHLIMAVIDDLGYDEVSWKNPLAHSPNIDRLATEGTILERHYAFHTCGPSRGSLLSGRLPYHVQQYNSASTVVDRRMTLLPEVLKGAGYKTAIVGKWGVGHLSIEHLPTRRGFDIDFCMLGTHANHWTHRQAGTDDDGVDLWSGSRPARASCLGTSDRFYPDCEPAEREHSCPFFSRRAVDVVDRHDPSKAPLFLYVAWTEVHDPYFQGQGPPVRYAERLPPSGCNSGYSARAVQRSMLACVDEATANLTAALRRKRMWNSTLMLWTSDNGGVIVEQGNNSPLRGGKATLFEGGMRVLSFLSGGWLPAAAPRTLDSLLSIADWYGTFARLAGVDDYSDARAAPHGLPEVESIDVWPLLTGDRSHPYTERRELLLSYVAHQGNGNPLPAAFGFDEATPREGRGESVAFLQGRYKLVGRDRTKGAPASANGGDAKAASLNTGAKTGWTTRDSCVAEHAPPDGGERPWLLFDLEADVSERHDLSAELPQVVDAMVARADELGRTAFQTPHSIDYLGLDCVEREAGDAHYRGYFGPRCAKQGSGYFGNATLRVNLMSRKRALQMKAAPTVLQPAS